MFTASHMRRFTRKRLLTAAGFVATLFAVMSLVTGITFALMSANTSAHAQANGFATGTVSVGKTGTQFTCNISAMNPGDSSAGAPIDSKADNTCKFGVQYTGSVNAWVAVDVAISNGATALYDGSNQGLQLYLSDGTTTYVTSSAADSGGSGTTYKAQNSGTATQLPSTGISDLLVSSTASTPGTTVPFALDYALPADTALTYEGGSATITLTFHAVQAGNNALPTGSNSCSTGQQCLTGMSWS